MRITSKMILKMLFHNSIKLNGKDFVAQNAYYHLEKVQLDKKQEALNAFKMLSEMAFDNSGRCEFKLCKIKL
jgi:hypothetical protein